MCKLSLSIAPLYAANTKDHRREMQFSTGREWHVGQIRLKDQLNGTTSAVTLELSRLLGSIFTTLQC